MLTRPVAKLKRVSRDYFVSETQLTFQLHSQYTLHVFPKTRKLFRKMEKKLNSLHRILKLATFKGVSEATIRNCVGRTRFYAILDNKSDLSVEKLKELSSILKLNKNEDIWVLYGETQYPINLEESAIEERLKQAETPKPSHTESSSSKAGVRLDKRLRNQANEPQPP